MRVYIGYDKREQNAYRVADMTARKFGLQPQPLYEERLRRSGFLTRPVDNRGQMYDLVSGAPQSTDFATARFGVPILAHSGWAMFVDCDTMFMNDPNPVFKSLDSNKAVYCVQHEEIQVAKGTEKMDGQVQTSYRRKLWSSVMIFNCDHPANWRLNIAMLNSLPGRELHAFCWLNDSEIGALPIEMNWLVNLLPKPETPIIAHYTLGTPNIPGLEKSPYAELWLEQLGQL